MEQEIQQLKEKLETLERILASHTHSGNDGSAYIYQDKIVLKDSQDFKSGDFRMLGLNSIEQGVAQENGMFIVGKDAFSEDGDDNAVIALTHQPQTTGTTNQTFLQGYRGKIFRGEGGKVVAGENTFSQKEFEFEPDSLVGEYLLVLYSSTAGQAFPIIANSKFSITVNGTWSDSLEDGQFTISMPQYLGSGTYPWRRVYVLEGTGGGVRFGHGVTGDGNNGLLFMSGDNLVFLAPSGTATVLA